MEQGDIRVKARELTRHQLVQRRLLGPVTNSQAARCNTHELGCLPLHKPKCSHSVMLHCPVACMLEVEITHFSFDDTGSPSLARWSVEPAISDVPKHSII